MKRILPVFAVLALTFFGCQEQGPAERAGEKLDEAGEGIKDGMQDACEAVKNAVDDTGDALKEAGEDIKEGVEEAGEQLTLTARISMPAESSVVSERRFAAQVPSPWSGSRQPLPSFPRATEV